MRHSPESYATPHRENFFIIITVEEPNILANSTPSRQAEAGPAVGFAVAEGTQASGARGPANN